MANMNDAPIGSLINPGNQKLKVVLTSTGCKGCAFETEQGARYCQFSAFCFAHRRYDNQSVKFIRVEK